MRNKETDRWVLLTPQPPAKRVPPASRGCAEFRGASEKSTDGLERGGSSPSLRFAGLSSTIRGHSHPTMREELEKEGEARQAPASYSSSHYRASHTAQADEKLSIHR